MEIYENPDFDLALTLAPFLAETNLSTVPAQLSDGPTLHMTHGGAAKFGFLWAEDTDGSQFALVGVPEIPSAITQGQYLFDVLRRCRLTKAYAVKGESSLFFVIQHANANPGKGGHYAISIPTTKFSMGITAREKKVMLCRMTGNQFDPIKNRRDTIELEVLILNARDWER